MGVKKNDFSEHPLIGESERFAIFLLKCLNLILKN